MKIDLRNVTTKWINLDAATEKNEQMIELATKFGFTNASRVSAVSGIEPHVGVNKGEEHYRSCAESHFKILQEAIDNNQFPILILEDDVDVLESAFIPEFECPDDADAIYFGTSHGDNNYEAIDQKNGWCKIKRVFATHAIMYLSSKYAEEVITIGKKWIYENNKPFDVGLAYELQHKYIVYSPYVPFFYQADRKNSVNKWEGLTKTPLKHKKKFSVFTI